MQFRSFSEGLRGAWDDVGTFLIQRLELNKMRYIGNTTNMAKLQNFAKVRS